MNNEYGIIDVGIQGEPLMMERLVIMTSNYGYRLYDKKLRKSLIINKSKESCLKGIELLKNFSYDAFLSYLELIKNEVVITKNILIVKDKHSDYVYSVSTIEDLHKVSLHILEERIEYGYIQRFPEKAIDLGYNEDDILKMPKVLQQNATEKLKNALKEDKGVKENNNLYDMAQQAIKEKNGEVAYNILCERSEYEYEKIELIKPILISEL